jgi:hypothetical protein
MWTVAVTMWRKKMTERTQFDLVLKFLSGQQLSTNRAYASAPNEPNFQVA